MKGSIEHNKLKNTLNKNLNNLSYAGNCGKCNMCTIKNYLELDKPPKCPKCESEKARIDWWNNPNNNWVKCENDHRYDIRQFCDLKDIELHQRTLREVSKKLKELMKDV